MTGETYALRGTAHPECLEELHELVGRAGKEHPEVPDLDFMLLETAVIEVAGNVVEHAAATNTVTFAFELRVLPDALDVRIDDDGPEFVGDLAVGMPGEFEESGRGLPMASSVLDEFTYTRDGSLNRWCLRRAVSV